MNHDHSDDMNKHLLIMLACCLVPLALILVVSVFGLGFGGLTPFIPYVLVLLCPLMMFFMMRGMMQDQATSHAQHQHGDSGGVDASLTAPTPRLASDSKRAVETNTKRGESH